MRYLALCFSMITCLATAQDAHVHGEGQLTLVLEGSTLLVELQSPLGNFLGFEHSPQNEEEWSAVIELEAELAKGETLLVTEGGDCSLSRSTVEGLPKRAHEQNIGSEDHSAHTSHQGADHDHGPDENHRDVHISYEYSCAAPANVNAIRIKMFDLFAGINTLEAQWVIGGRQGSRKLTPINSVLKLTE